MKTRVAFYIFLFVLANLSASVSQKSLTDPAVGMQTVFDKSIQTTQNNVEPIINTINNRVELLWQASDPAAICHACEVSAVSEQSFIGWNLNNSRVTLYEDSSVPLWDHYTTSDYNYPTDINDLGTVLGLGDGSLLKIFDNTSSNPTWEHTTDGTIVGLELDSNGTTVYTAFYNSTFDYSTISAYEVGNSFAIWSVTFAGNAGNLVLSGDDSTLIFTQYGAISAMWVLAAENGSIIFEGPEYNQNPPAISDDASLIVNGDYSGYVTVYEYNSNIETYQEKWNYRVGGGSAWIGGMSISADGSTIAVGTLIFLSNGYDGEIYLFNSYSPEPIWIYENVGDYIISIDITDNGDLIAAAGWGPMGNATADFFLFRRESNIPVFEINSPGSLFTVDIAADGSFCTTGGKAVHAREFGNGGYVYCVDCDLGGGFVIGSVNLEDNQDNSGVKVEFPDLVSYYDYTDTDGSYGINNIPAGSYYVQCTKIGYYTGIIPDVTVEDGEITDLDIITLQPAGSAPENFYASEATGIEVDLSWDPPLNRDPIAYNIYRKTYEQEPYPETPLATVDVALNSYEDDTALPGYQYYYVVNALYENDLQGPYSNESQGWITTSFIIDDISVYEGEMPVIDGIISPGEWDDAFLVDCSDFCGTYDGTVNPIGSVIGYFKVNSGLSELYGAFINYNDTVLEDHDEVALYIDDNNDGTYPPLGDDSEGNYWCAYYASGNQIKYRPIYETGGVGTVIYLNNPQLEVSVDEGYLVYEFILPIGVEYWMINPGPENISGMGLFVLDDNTPDPHGFDSWWPYDNLNIFSPEGYGTISFGAGIQEPLPPENVTLTLEYDLIHISWDMPPINNLDYFNIYYQFEEDRDFDLLDSTIGTAYDLEVDQDGVHSFYLTTVNQFGSESDPSETVEYVTAGSTGDDIPLITELVGNYPNPFNPDTIIMYKLASPTRVDLRIYNIKGQLINKLVDEVQNPGIHQILWQGNTLNDKKVAAGIYFYKLKTSGYSNTRKMVILK